MNKFLCILFLTISTCLGLPYPARLEGLYLGRLDLVKAYFQLDQKIESLLPKKTLKTHNTVPSNSKYKDKDELKTALTKSGDLLESIKANEEKIQQILYKNEKLSHRKTISKGKKYYKEDLMKHIKQISHDLKLNQQEVGAIFTKSFYKKMRGDVTFLDLFTGTHY